MSATDLLIARTAARQHGVVAAWQLAPQGVTARALERRVADGRLHRLHRGVFAVGRRQTSVRGRWIAAVLACGPPACLSHGPAAALWDLIAPDGRPVHVTITGGSRARRRGIVTHRSQLPPEDRTVIDAIPVTSLARTLLDLGEVATPKEHRRAYERAERLQVLDTRAIERLLERSNGRRGVGRLRALLGYDPSAAAQAVSELELLLLDLARLHSLPPPQVNVLVAGHLVDAHWPEARLVVEVDGYEHHSGRDAFERDHAKIAALTLAGYRVLPFTYRQVTREPEWVAGTIRRLLARATGEANV